MGVVGWIVVACLTLWFFVGFCDELMIERREDEKERKNTKQIFKGAIFPER